METYNFFVGICHNCKKDVRIQTRIGEHKLSNIKINDTVKAQDMNLECMYRCDCGARLVVKIENKRYLGYVRVSPTHREIVSGQIEEVKKRATKGKE